MKNRSRYPDTCSDLVRVTGIEPAWIAPPDPKSGASASSAIPAKLVLVYQLDGRLSMDEGHSI